MGVIFSFIMLGHFTLARPAAPSVRARHTPPRAQQNGGQGGERRQGGPAEQKTSGGANTGGHVSRWVRAHADEWLALGMHAVRCGWWGCAAVYLDVYLSIYLGW